MNGGDEDRYLGLLLDAGIAPGTSFNPDLRLAFIDAYSGCESLRCGFQHYWRAALDQAVGDAIADPGRPVVLTLAIAGAVVGDATIGDTRGDSDSLSVIAGMATTNGRKASEHRGGPDSRDRSIRAAGQRL
jgi:hypothetical protein